MLPNPYLSPQDTTEEDRREVTLARSALEDDDDPIALKINIPAFGLSATSWMKLVFEGPIVIWGAMMSVAELYNWVYYDGEPFIPLIVLVVSSAAVAIDLLILQGTSAMFARRRIGRARRAAVLALLPTTPLFILQVPFGIWTLYTLQDPQVQTRFER